MKVVAAVATSATSASGNTASPRASVGKILAVVEVPVLATGLLVVVKSDPLPVVIVREVPSTASSKIPAIFDSRVTTRPFEMVVLSDPEEVLPYSAFRVVEAPTVV